jgi:hypothetical protein
VEQTAGTLTLASLVQALADDDMNIKFPAA